ncbi:MAG: hypothetical protein H7067_09590, partial [Burkholderiales bacterium]|nr:hypothetical protein [Opitutaceae bacterium]
MRAPRSDLILAALLTATSITSGAWSGVARAQAIPQEWLRAAPAAREAAMIEQ